MLLKRYTRNSLQKLPFESIDTHNQHVKRIVRYIYASVIHVARKKQRMYKYVLPHISKLNGSKHCQEYKEVLADVIYDLMMLFPVCDVYSIPGILNDSVCVSWL